jgi:hypothetical protein
VRWDREGSEVEGKGGEGLYSREDEGYIEDGAASSSAGWGWGTDGRQGQHARLLGGGR